MPEKTPATPDPAIIDWERYLDAVAPALGLAVGAAQRPGVLFHLRNQAAHGARVMAAALEDDVEPAPVYEA